MGKLRPEPLFPPHPFDSKLMRTPSSPQATKNVYQVLTAPYHDPFCDLTTFSHFPLPDTTMRALQFPGCDLYTDQTGTIAKEVV